MRFYFKIIVLCSILSSCLAQRPSSTTPVLNEIYVNQLAIYNRIENKGNYASIISFAKGERFKVFKQIKGVIRPDNFNVLEGYSPGWGTFVGLIWNNKVAFSYKRSSIDHKLTVVKTTLSEVDLKRHLGIDLFIVEKINDWDLNYIKNTGKAVGMGVSDGFYFLATKVSTDTSQLGQNPKIESFAFEQFTK